MKWRKIESDRFGVSTDDCLNEMKNQAPILLYNKLDKGCDLIEHSKDVDASNVFMYTHYMPIRDGLHSLMARFASMRH